MKFNIKPALCIFLLFSITTFQTWAQVGIGTNNPDSSSVLDIFSNQKGILMPRLSEQQRDSIENPAPGLTIFNTTTGCYNYYFSSDWMEVCGRLKGKITLLNCAGSSNNGVIMVGAPAINVSSVVPYTGGNGGYHNGQTVSSTGVTGLTATLTAGNFAVGSGTLTYTIAGTPDTSGIASFALNIGGKTCLFERVVDSFPPYPPGTVHCMATPTAVIEVINPATGRIWMDRNLGASQVATSYTDAASYGDLYQWGRRADGHQCRNSGTTTSLSNSDQPVHGNFIITNNYSDWRSPQNNNLWQGVNGINNPCPSGYRLPTETEFIEERATWGSQDEEGQFASPLKLPLPGRRPLNQVVPGGEGEESVYWTSTINGSDANGNHFQSGVYGFHRADGHSVRCIKDEIPVFNGTIQMLDCNNADHYGTLTSGVTASGVTSAVPFSGGNGGYHYGQTVNSTGITGLTATLTAGPFTNGSGTLTYTITGTPDTSGTASFYLSIGGQSCTLTRVVNSGQVTDLHCAGATHNGTLVHGVPAIGVSSMVPYTGGNGGLHNGQVVNSTGVTGLTATLLADTFAIGDGTLSYTISGTPDTSGTVSFALNIGGQTCTLTREVNPGQVIYLDCAGATHDGTLVHGVSASGVSSVVPYSGGNGGPYNGQVINSTGVSGLTATLAVGSFAAGDSTLSYTITGTPDTSGTASFVLNIGGKICNLTRIVNTGMITSLYCEGGTNNGTLTRGTVATGVNSVVPYSGGNGGAHIGQIVNSTGVNGLTATLTADTFVAGNGTLSYTITGTPDTIGTASFALNIGGQTCTLTRNVNAGYPPGTVHCNDTPSTVVDVLNPITGKTWMDRNLGASQKATSSTDAASYGDLYQWGRRADGHNCRNSATTTTLGNSDLPSHGNFILAPNSPNDWRSPQNANLWQGMNGVNNPCPSGYRLPTDSELEAERTSWSSNNAAGAFASPLKWPRAGGRSLNNGSLFDVGTHGLYWSSTVLGSFSQYLYFDSNNASMYANYRAFGYAVRCMKHPGQVTTLDCAGATHNGTLVHGGPATGVSSVVPYTGGNGGLHIGQVVNSTGVTGLTAILSDGTFTAGDGTLSYTITGTPDSSGMASFELNIGGQTCTLTRLVNPGQLTTLNCAGVTHNGTLVYGVPASGVSSVVPYTGGNGGLHIGQVVNSSGVTGLTATLTAGNFAAGDGTLSYTITGTPDTSGTASFALNIGGQTCTLTRIVNTGLVATLNCTGATNNGTLTQGTVAYGVNSVIPYTGGNGGPHNGQVVMSIGVTGLTATLNAGTFVVGNGTLTYTITGTPATNGTASFSLNIGGQTCTLTRNVNPPTYPPGTVHCTGTPTAIVDVLNPTTGKTWMDRNLGANQVATSSTDAASYGDLYQWGRRADGHQCRTSGTTTTLSNSDQPQHGSFIRAPNSPFDWRSPQNTNLWQGVNGVNNPCPSGYRLPTETELNAERASWSSNNAAGAFASPLKLPMAGIRNNSNGSLGGVGSNGVYWSSTVSGTDSSYLFFFSSRAEVNTSYRAFGFSVRCLKD